MQTIFLEFAENKFIISINEKLQQIEKLLAGRCALVPGTDYTPSCKAGYKETRD